MIMKLEELPYTSQLLKRINPECPQAGMKFGWYPMNITSLTLTSDTETLFEVYHEKLYDQADSNVVVTAVGDTGREKLATTSNRNQRKNANSSAG